MIYLGVVLLIIGILVAVLVHNQIGVAVAVVGLLLILLGLLLPFSDADAAVLALPFGPHMARLFRWAADRLDPQGEHLRMTWQDPGGFASYTIRPSWSKPGDPTRN
jgi:hypothetical protein